MFFQYIEPFRHESPVRQTGRWMDEQNYNWNSVHLTMRAKIVTYGLASDL